MITRDILNHLSEKIGEMEFPEGTSEGAISAKIAPYAAAPPSKTPSEIALAKVKKMTRFNIEMKEVAIAENILLGISSIPDGRNKCDLAFGPAFEEMRNCKYPEAIGLLYALKADTSKHVSPIITPERIQGFIEQITNFLSNL